MKQQSLLAFLRRHPGVIVSVGYVAVSLIGMLFSQALFSRFGINYFNYAEVSDFLLAALREPMTFALAGGAVVVTLLIFGITKLEQQWIARRSPKSRVGKFYQSVSNWAYNNVGVIIASFLLYAYLFLNLYGDWKSEQIKTGSGKQVTVELANEVDGAAAGKRLDGVMLLGTSNKFLFIYDLDARRAYIIPNENISRLIITAAEPSTADALDDPPEKGQADGSESETEQESSEP